MLRVFWLVAIAVSCPATALEKKIAGQDLAPSAGFHALLDYSLHRINRRNMNEGIGKREVSQVLTVVKHVAETYMKQCGLLVVLHSTFKFETSAVKFDASTLFRTFARPAAHTQVTKSNKVRDELLEMPGSSCRGFMVFIKDVALTVKIIGNHTLNKVVVVTASSRWKIEEFLESSEAKGIVNLLIIATTGASDIIIRRGEKSRAERFLNLYTHELFVDGVGNSKVRLLTSWRSGVQARNVSLFPTKITKGFNGRQFAVVASVQPPFVIKKQQLLADDADTSVLWDGIEVRLMHLLSQFLNYTMEITEANPVTILKGSAEAVAEAVANGKAEIGLGGVYRSADLSSQLAFSMPHSTDCAAFVTRSSTALPRYRAIIGPFHWHVWLALTLTYVIAILPLTFAEQHSLMYLWEHPWHFETMFWYVFGTFTNCFTFKGEHSWTNSDKNASRLLVGWYWAFSIIVTACYTGSIISFITLFVYPPVIDTVDQLLAQNFRVGSLSTGSWGSWFNNSEHPETKWLLRDIELVPNVTQGLKNVTGSFYLPLLRPYTFLASSAQLEYVIKTNFTLKNRKDVLHVSKYCFVPFGVSLIYPRSAPYRHKMDEFILRAQQSGLIGKVFKQMQWELQRSATGERLQAGSGASLRDALVQDRRLSLDDTQGMFLLLGAGFLIATAALISEVSGHHHASGRTWKLWLWRPTLSTHRGVAWLRETFPECFPTYITPTPRSESFVYKTYDSRVLNSKYQNVAPVRFGSESRLFYKQSAMMWTASMPNLALEKWMHPPSSSCQEMHRPRSSATLQYLAKANEKSMRFCSVGSILGDNNCKEALELQFYYDRPQTSII